MFLFPAWRQAEVECAGGIEDSRVIMQFDLGLFPSEFAFCSKAQHLFFREAIGG